jgi:hypothetical protein
VAEIPPGLRAELDRELETAVATLLTLAARYDGVDLVEANVELCNDIRSLYVPTSALTASVAMLALRLHRAGDPRG